MTVNVVEISNVSKRFVIHRDKSLKERVVNSGGPTCTRTTSGPCVT